MNKSRAYWPLDDAPVSDGDAQWRGVDERQDPGTVPAMFVSRAINTRFTEGIPMTRAGIRKMPWSGQVFDYVDPGMILPYGNVAAAEMYSDPYTGLDFLVIVTDQGIFKARPGTCCAGVPLPSSEPIPSRVNLIQTYSGMVMLRGRDFDPLYMVNLDEGFKKMPEATIPGNRKIPPSMEGIYEQNRLFVIDERLRQDTVDTIFVSDFGSVTSVLEGPATYNSFKINTGSSDRLKAVYPYTQSTFIAAKERSVYVITGVQGTNQDIATNAAIDTLTSEYGCTSPRSFVNVGKDVWFMANRRGVVSIRATSQNLLQGVDVPISRDIEPVIQRINWESAVGIVAASIGNHVYFAVPLNSARYNNAVLVYDILQQAWSGYDLSDAIRVRDWVKFPYAGATRLGFVSDDGFINLYEDGGHDQLGTPSGLVVNVPIEMSLLSRGYVGGTGGRKNFSQVQLDYSTWNPNYSITARVDGVHETRDTARERTKSRTRYTRPYGKPDWESDNSNDDFHDPYREDYSLDPGPFIDIGLNGHSVGLEQKFSEGYRLHAHGRYVQVEIQNVQGAFALRSIQVDAIRGETRLAART